MDHKQIIENIHSNQATFSRLFMNKEKEEYLWKPEPKS